MCIIIYKEPGLIIDDETLRQAWSANPHGAGFAYYDPEKGWIARKGFLKLKEFMHAYRPFGDQEAVLHFRIATHGAINAENTHPFMRDDGLTLFHNGILSQFGSREVSDTGDFFKNCMSHLPLNSCRHELLEELAESSGSKFVLLEEDHNITLAGHFHEYEGLLVSNLSLKPFPKRDAGGRWIGKGTSENPHRYIDDGESVDDTLKERLFENFDWWTLYDDFGYSYEEEPSPEMMKEFQRRMSEGEI